MKKAGSFVVVFALALGACAHLGGAKSPEVALPGRFVQTCKDPNPGNIFREPDGGYHESFQGWFHRAELRSGSGAPLLYCHYGLDRAAPANRPVYSVHYPLTGFSASQCSLAGRTVTCTRTLTQ